ncbi:MULTISPECIES: hypothetical protein [unclassified Streptomyces]|uniref:hypothetical protein n=1 Tax=unclassified Streptomyces TaxID=2593676 RepID=UPI002E0D6EB6|nr:hypothetical protein OG452_19325 [Streptomyces sp. NBC_01197]WSS50001.1 hypothetical protein OG708_15930 [Streptomyces sp. NBC_01180]
MRKYNDQIKTVAARRGVKAALVAAVAGATFASVVGAGAVTQFAAGPHTATTRVAADVSPASDHGWD